MMGGLDCMMTHRYFFKLSGQFLRMAVDFRSTYLRLSSGSGTKEC